MTLWLSRCEVRVWEWGDKIWCISGNKIPDWQFYDLHVGPGLARNAIKLTQKKKSSLHQIVCDSVEESWYISLCLKGWHDSNQYKRIIIDLQIHIITAGW